ncbi:MAG TPA: hypothetical protein VEJ88_03595, partial [Dissulfurispiraceae bacterium]|nr:hypothetical protein [Dissulfurispiraceae bacterium]
NQHFIGMRKRCKSTSAIKHKTKHKKKKQGALTLSGKEVERHYMCPEKQFIFTSCRSIIT